MSTAPDDLAEKRERMLRRHLAGRGVRDPRLLAAMRQVPRERFVEPGSEALAYEDFPLAIGHGQTISQPYIVAAMIEAAEVAATDTVLEVGAGSGYAATVLSRVAARVARSSGTRSWPRRRATGCGRWAMPTSSSPSGTAAAAGPSPGCSTRSSSRPRAPACRSRSGASSGRAAGW